MIKTIIRAIVRAFIGIGNIRKRMEDRSQQKKLDAAKYYSKRFCYIQDYKGKPYVWLHDIPAFAIEDYADHGKDILTLGEACDFMERMRGKYVEEHREDGNSRVAACL